MACPSQKAPTNLLKCLELDQAYVGHPLLHRQQYVTNGLATTSCMHTTDIMGHHGCVNAVSFSNLGEEFLVTGGDDERVLVWRLAEVMRGKCHPTIMAGRHQSNVFSAVFSCNNAYIYSGGNDGDVIQHDFPTGHHINTIEHHDAVYCVAAHPSSPHIILTASEDGTVHIVDTRLPARLTEDMVLAENLGAYQSVAINPVEPRLVAVSNTQHGTSLLDTRERRQILSYKCTRWGISQDDCVSVCFNSTGTQLFTLQRQLSPCVFDIWSREAKYSFTDDTGVYRNSVTMKSGCFMGQRDEFVVSGSDDFRLYIWKIPDDEPNHGSPYGSVSEALPHLVLPGHRSIVNQVRYSRTHHLLCSSGVEKVVKLWSHLPLPPLNEIQHSGASPSRRMYSRSEFFQMSVDGDSLSPADPLQEDPTVLAFFDALVDQDRRTTPSSSTSSSTEISDFVESDSESSLSLYSDSDMATFHYHMDWDHFPFYDSDDVCWGSGTPSSLSPANTSSLEPPWSDFDLEEWEEEEEKEEEEEEEEGSSSPDMEEDWNGDSEWQKARAAHGLRQTTSRRTVRNKKSQNGQQTSDQNSHRMLEKDPSKRLKPLNQATPRDSEESLAGARGRSLPQQKQRHKKQQTYCRTDFLKTKPAPKFYSSKSSASHTSGSSASGTDSSNTVVEDQQSCCEETSRTKPSTECHGTSDEHTATDCTMSNGDSKSDDCVESKNHKVQKLAADKVVDNSL